MLRKSILLKSSLIAFCFLATFVTTLLSCDQELLGASHKKSLKTERKSPQQVEEELQQVIRDFQTAKNIFNPRYTGPLITGSANNAPPGKVNIQPYLFLTSDYGSYTKHRKFEGSSNTYFINPLFFLQIGLTSLMDLSILPQGFYKWSQGRYSEGFGDTQFQVGFQIHDETPYIPAIRLVISENFPTGRYRRLNPANNGIDAMGAGVFSSAVGLNISKVLWWFLTHPQAVRLALNYTFANNKADVVDFNAYGGGNNTRGKIAVGNNFSADFGYELSLTEKWVFATDIAYTLSSKSTFIGTPGTTPSGGIASNGAPISSNLSFAPAIEYNPSVNGGFIGGVWFSATGRNSTSFVSVVLSYTQMF